jgi:hypothetical protein
VGECYAVAVHVSVLLVGLGAVVAGCTANGDDPWANCPAADPPEAGPTTQMFVRFGSKAQPGSGACPTTLDRNRGGYWDQGVRGSDGDCRYCPLEGYNEVTCINFPPCFEGNLDEGQYVDCTYSKVDERACAL